MDLNEIAMNLVPFPRLHYLVPSLTPLYTLTDASLHTRRSAAVAAPAIFYLTVVLTPAELRVLAHMNCTISSRFGRSDDGSPAAMTPLISWMFEVIRTVVLKRDETELVTWYKD